MIRETLWTEETLAALQALASEGKSGEEIGRALGFSRNAILGKCHRSGIKLYGAPGMGPRITDEVRAEVRRLYLAGERFDEIVRLTGVKTSSIGHLTHDLPRRRKVAKAKRYRDDAFKVAALSAHLLGESGYKLARRLGVDHYTLRNYRRDPEILTKAQALADTVRSRYAVKQAAEAAERQEAERLERERIDTHNAPILDQMPWRHLQMMVARIGGQTLQEIGQCFGVSSERIRQIEIKWRLRGLIIPGAKPLSEAARHYDPKARGLRQSEKVSVFERAHALIDKACGKPGKTKVCGYTLKLSPEERQRRSDWMRQVNAARRQAEAGHA